MSSPTARTLALCKKQGFVCQVVERWNPHARVRQDLFGIIDVLAMNGDKIIGIQATSGTNVAARLSKARESESVRLWLAAPGRKFFVHGWRKVAKTRRWMCREIELRIENGELVCDETR